MSTPPELVGADLPPDMLSLARMMARDCRAPGQYVVYLTVPPYPRDPVQVEIKTVSTIRDTVVSRQKG